MALNMIHQNLKHVCLTRAYKSWLVQTYILGLCCFWGECSQEEEAKRQHMIFSMMLCVSKSVLIGY